MTIDEKHAAYAARVRLRIAEVASADLETCLDVLRERCDCELDDELHEAAANRVRALFVRSALG